MRELVRSPKNKTQSGLMSIPITSRQGSPSLSAQRTYLSLTTGHVSPPPHLGDESMHIIFTTALSDK